jgi:hypothetical protein
MAPDDPDKTKGWDVGFDGHRRAQQRRLARMSFAEKLDWLEEAHELVKHLSRGPVGGSGPAIVRDAGRTPTDE